MSTKETSSDPPISSFAFRDTWLNRTLTLLALKTAGRCYRNDGPCVPISPYHIVKISRFVGDLGEATTLRYIATNTSIPVPKVCCAFVHKRLSYIVMERIHGVTLASAFRGLSLEERQSIWQQLQSFVGEIRALRHEHEQRVEDCAGGSLLDTRIPHANALRWGPFDTVDAFHCWLRKHYELKDYVPRTTSLEGEHEELIHMYHLQDNGPWAKTVFTHGDLNPSNILVREGEVVAIIDWAFSGWYPEYWEYTSAWCGNITRKTWQEVLPNFLEEYPEALKMEITRQQCWGELFR